jgi:hypothetical protein
MLSSHHALIFQKASFLKASHQNPSCTSVVLHMCYGAQIIKILIMQIPYVLCIVWSCCSVYCYVCKCVLLPLGVNPIAVKYIISFPPSVTIQSHITHYHFKI